MHMAVKSNKTTKSKKKNITLDDLALMMGRGFNEVHGKFDEVHGKFNEVYGKFDEVYGKFDEVHDKMDKGFLEVDEKIKYIVSVMVTKEEISELPTKDDFNNLLTSVDEYAKKADTYFQEMVVTAHKMDRMERWILQLAEKVGVQLKA